MWAYSWCNSSIGDFHITQAFWYRCSTYGHCLETVTEAGHYIHYSSILYCCSNMLPSWRKWSMSQFQDNINKPTEQRTIWHFFVQRLCQLQFQQDWTDYGCLCLLQFLCQIQSLMVEHLPVSCNCLSKPHRHKHLTPICSGPAAKKLLQNCRGMFVDIALPVLSGLGHSKAHWQSIDFHELWA